MKKILLIFGSTIIITACSATDLQAFANAMNSLGDGMHEQAAQINQNTQYTQYQTAMPTYQKPISKVCYRGSNYITCN